MSFYILLINANLRMFCRVRVPFFRPFILAVSFRPFSLRKPSSFYHQLSDWVPSLLIPSHSLYHRTSTLLWTLSSLPSPHTISIFLFPQLVPSSFSLILLNIKIFHFFLLQRDFPNVVCFHQYLP